MRLKKRAYPNPPTRELWLGHDETSEKVHEAIECSRNNGSHHEVGGQRHAGHAIVGEVQQGQEHEQEEPEELGCSTPKARLGGGSLTAGPKCTAGAMPKKQDQTASSAVRLQDKDTGNQEPEKNLAAGHQRQGQVMSFLESKGNKQELGKVLDCTILKRRFR